MSMKLLPLLTRRLSTARVVRSFSSAAAAMPKMASILDAAGGHYLKTLVADNPYTDVVQYEHQNRTFTVNDIEKNADALAIEIAENGLQSGDVILSYLPEHFNEQMILQFACSKAGFLLYTLDPAVAVTDPDKAQRILSAALTLTQANVLISQEARSDVNYIRLVEKLVPELRFFDFACGMPFVTPRYPHLRFCIHTAMDQDQKWGWLPLHHMVVPSNNLDTHIHLAQIDGKTPLAGTFVWDKEGIPTGLGKPLSNAQVYESKLWKTYCNVLDRKFHQVPGVGVIF